MYKSKRQVNRKSFDWYGLSQRFSIRKYHFGAASVLLGTALILGSPQATAKADDGVSANTAQTSTGQGVDEGTNSATDGLKNVTLPTASTTEAAVLEKPTLSDEEIAKLAATSETPAITSTSETAKEVKAESKPATSDAVVKTNTEEKAKTDKLTEKETKAEDKAEKKVDKQAETASQKTILTQLTSEAEVLNTTAANYAEKKVEDKASKDAIASAVATAKTEIAASKKALEAGEITKAELDAQLQRISSAIEAVYAEMKRGGHIGKVEAMLADVSSTINLPERTIVKRVNDLTDTEVEEIIRQIRIANPNLTKNDIITVDRGASTSAASGGATITFANGDTARLGAGDILTGIGGAKNADTLRQAINWFEFSSATIVYPDGTQAGPARYLDNPINMQVDSPDGTGKMTGRLTMVRDVIYTDGSKGLTTDERFKNLGVAEYSTHKYYTGGYQNNNEVYEVLKEGMVLKVPTRVEGYQLTLRVDKLGPKPVATDPNNTATRGKNAKGASEGVNKYKPVKMIMTTQDTTYSYLKQAGMDITVPDRDSSGNPIAGTSRPALAAITPNWDGANAGVTFSASATYNGVPVPVNLVASDGEEGGRGEFLQFVTNGSNWEELMALNLNKNGGYVYGTNKLDLNGYLKLNENGYNIDEWVTNPQAVDEKGNLRFADSSKTQRIMDVYGTKEFGPAWTAMRQGNALPIGFSQNVSQFSMYMHSTGAQAGTIGFITFDGGDAPESYGKAQHVIGNINKTLSDGRQVTASQPFLGDQPGDPDFRSTSDEHDKTGAWVLDDLVNTAKHRQVDVKTGNEISNESGDTGTYAIVNGNPVIRKTDGSTVAIKTGEIVTVKNPDDTFPIRGIFDTASQSVGVGSLPDEGRGQLLDSAVATDYKLRQATDNEYVLNGVRANLGQNNDVAYVRGWVDFNGNGKFDDGESSEVIELRQNKTISLKFKNIPQLLNTSIDSVGVRLRIALDKEEILKPTGLASSGEVEDFLTHVIHPPRGTRTKTKNYQGEKQSLEMTTSDLFTATGKTDRSKYQNWNQIDQTIPPKIVVTESVVAKEVPTGDADVNVTDPSGTTVYRGTVVKVYDKRNNELGTAVKVTNPLNGTTEYLLSNYTEYDTAGNKVGVYSLNKENNGLNKADSNGIYKTKIEFTPELGYVGTAKGIAIRAWDENRVSTGWSANDKTIEESKRNITLADKDKILANVNEDVNGRESMDTTYVPTVVDIKPVGKDETTTDVQGKEQSATPKIPDHGTVESITDSSVDESKISKEHVLIDKTKPITFAHEKVIPGKVYTEDTKVTEETVLTYEDGGTETFKPADKIPAGTEIAKNSAVTITGEGNVPVRGVRIGMGNEGLASSPNKVPAGSVLEGAQPTAPQPIKVLRNGVEVTVNTGEKLKVGDQLVDPLPITGGAQITTWKVTLQKGDVIPQSYSTLKPTLAEATGVDKITGTKGATLTYDGNKYVYNNDTIPQGTRTVGTTVDLSTVTLPNATHVDPATGVVTTVPRRYTTISDNKIVIENEGTYTIVPKTSTNEKGQTIYEDAKVVFTPDPKFVGVGTGVTLKQPDLDYNTRVDGDKVTSRYGTDYGYAKYTPVVNPDLTATITRKIHYVYEGDKSTPATAKKPILTIDDKPVVNEQTLTYNRDYVIMEKDGATEKDIKVANAMTLDAPITIKRVVTENNQAVEKEITTNTLQPGDEVKAGTQLKAGTVIIGAWKPINDENAKFTPIISPVLKGYTAEVQLPATEYTKKDTNGVQTHVRNANNTPAGIYTPSAPGGTVDTVNVGAYEPLVSVVRADDQDNFDVYVYYKADKQKANVVYIDLDEKGDKRVLETQSGTKATELPTGTTQDPKTTYGVEKLSGESASTIPYDTADTIKKYTDKGYELASDDYKNDEKGKVLADGRKFDEDSSVDQTFYVYLRHKKEQLSKNDVRTVTRHIEYKYADTAEVPADKRGQAVETTLAKKVTEVLTFERTRTIDMAATAKLYETQYNAYKAVAANNAVGSDAEVEARATLFKYVEDKAKEAGATAEAKAVISYGEWQAKPGQATNLTLSAAEENIKDSKFNDVVSPTVPGYLPDNAKVEATADINPESDPKEYTVTVTYSPGDQKAIVNFVEVDATNTDQVITPGLADPVTITGKSGAAFPTTASASVQAKIDELVKKGYELVDNGNGFVATDSFDTNADVDQTYTVKLRAKTAPVVPTDNVTPVPGQPVDPNNPTGPKWPESVKNLVNKDTVKRTIKYVYEDGTPVIDPATGAQKVVEQTAEFTRPANVNLVTGDITYGAWTPAEGTDLVAVTSPTSTDIPAVAKYVPSTATVPVVKVQAGQDDITETVVYRQVKPVTITPDAKVPNPEDPSTPADNPIQPNKPIDPNNPEGPKWTKELIDKLRAAREETVTRTITYKYSTETSELKAEDAAKAGQTAADTVTNSVTFKRPVTIDPVTKEFTYGDWVADNNDTTLEGKADLPVVAGYVATGDVEASKKDVTDVKATDKDITENVVYKTVGKYVPVIPDGITPPANINVDPKPYNNDPQDGSKVKDPDPTNPVVPGTTTPIVPQIPGTTPVGPDGKPLKPVDPADPSKGYVPPTPTDPTKDTSIIYVKDGSQVAVVHFVDEKGNSVNESVVETGDTGNTISTTKADAVKAALEAKGYEVVAPTDALYTADKEGFYKEADRKFDAVSDKATGAADEKIPSQQYYVIVKAKDLPVDPTKPVDPNNNPVDPTNPTPENPTKPRDPETPVTPKPEDKVPNDPKGRTYGELGLVEQVTRTINYVKNDGTKAAEPVKETLTFTRKAKINAVTGEVTYLAADGVTASTKEDAPWTPVNGDKFTEKVSPAVPNYTPTVEKVAEKTGVTATDEDIVETVVYNPTKQTVDPNAPKDPSTPDVTPKPNDVVPNDPKGRTYKELGLIEEVTRTVHYVYEDGTKAAEDKVQTITFTRTAEIDTVTGAISNFGTWTLKDENNTFEPETTEAKAGYVASAAKSTEVTGVQATDKDTEETIIYRKLGSYVPVVPAGVTPPANFDKTPKPYPNATPEDPTRPGTPTTPTTTIPEIPGTTPVGPDGTPLTKNPNGGYDLPPVPTDPTQNTTITYVKDGSQVAVVHFVDEKGNSVNESVVETGDTGKEISKSNVDAVKAKLEAKGYEVVAPTDALYTTDKEGFYKEATRTFDAVSDKSTGTVGEKVPSQQYYVIVKGKDLPVDPTKPLDPNNNPVDPTNPTPENPTKPRDPETPVTPKPEDKVPNDPKGRTYGELGLVEQVTRTINYVKNDGSKAAEPVKETLTFTRKAKINAVTGEVTYLAADGVTASTKEDAPWTPVNGDKFTEKVSPAVPNYTPTVEKVAEKTGVTATDEDIVETVVYNPTKQTVDPNAPKDPSTPDVTPKPNDVVPNDPKGRTYKELGLIEEVTRTVHYVYEDGTKAAEDKVQTITFTRTAEIDTVTGAISNFGTWTLKDENNTFEPETTEAKAGYVASAAKSTEVTGVQATDKDTEETIIYRKLGSYVPVVPAGVTPPANFDKTPKPYPNATPEDPTRPGTPTTPTTTIPEIPGTTPVGPDGTPLTKNPNGGYDLPPVPTDPTQNTTITYVKDGSQVAVVHFVDEKGNSVNESVVETGDTGKEISKSNVDAVKAKLEAKGYEVVAPTDALYTTDKEGFYKEATRTFDAVSDKSTGTVGEKVPSQQYYVIVKGKDLPVDPTKPLDPNNNPVDPTNPTPENPTKPRDPETPVTPKPEDKVPNDPKGRTYGELGLVEQVTRTINYVKNDGSKAAEPVKETLTFTRKAKINAVTGEVTYLDNDGNATTKEAAPWTPVNNDTTFDKVTSPSVPDYTPTKAEVPAKENVTATDEDIVETVVYNPTKVTVTPNNPNVDPEKPLNPNDPNGLKYKDLKLTEEVKRTITYAYADDVADTSKRGTDAAPKHETTVSFTRTATVNQATGEVTYGDWTAVNNDTTLEGKTELPVIPGYVATGDVESVKKDVANVSATDKDIVEKVVYKDLGKYVPVVSDGTTPPTITDPKYPNNPTDPTKPGEPTTTIPNVPGLTPLDPSTGKPLEPKDPNDLTKGYKPPVPQDPSKDTNIVYVADGSQVTVVHFVDEDGNAVHTSFVEAGDAGAKFTKAGEVTKVVEELKAAGYTVVPNKAGQAEYPGEAGVFDSVDDKGKDGVSQVYYVTVAKTVPVTPTTPQNPNEDPKNPKPGDPIDPNKPDGPKWTEDALNKLNNIKSVTRTITYVKDGTDEEVSTTEAPKVTNKVSFTRTAIVNPKDGSVVGYDTNGDGKVDLPATDTTNGWTAAGTAKFAEVKSPVVKGYVVKPNQDTQGDLVEADGSKVKASATDLTVDSANQDLKVRYVPVGSWTPKVPDGDTPIDPIPYPNDPKDPGKVVDPNKPTDPNDPNKPSVPVVPHIPGTTPKDPNGNPLKPVDPEDPSKGYVPPTPTTPTENTVIEYVKDDQKAVTKFVDPSGNPIPGVNNIEEKGKSGEPLTKATEVANEIAKLIAKGYELVSNNYGKDNNGNFDKDSGKDQEYTVVLTPHVEPIKPFDPTNPNDPNKPKPGTPIDPNNPDGPKWTEELIKSLETTKHVTRTISYVDKDGNKVEYTDKDGNKSTADVTDKVTFTREAKINLVTGAIEYGKWTPVNNDTTFDKVTSPVVPGYVLKDPAQKEVAETTGLTENSKDENIKVVYVPVGKLVPKVPDGVTPPTPTPYDNDPQDPGKVVPPSPTKPQDPQDPNSPKVPVIPHIPGTTPKVPQDPTKPVDPNTNPLVPLKPVDPKDPSKGYEVPPVPTNPGTDTPIVYENDKQKAITNFVDNNGKVVSDPVVDQGDSGSKFTKSGEVESKIQELVKKGYIVTSNDYPSADTDRVFDNDKDKDQIFNVKVTPLIVPTDPNSPDKPQVPTDPTKPVGPNNPLKPVTPSNPEPGKPVFPEDPNSPVWPETVKDLVTESSATRTITYVDQNGKEVAATHTETIKFKRTAKVNLVTGDITYGEWTVVGDDTILNGNPLPSVKGYIARGGDIKESQEDIKAEAGKNITQTVVYAKLGSWIPRLPEGQTNVPPTPYPNDPTDPTKPGTDKPKVPYVPGFIPVDPNGNPLKPVDPNDPTKGYEVPDVPADPTQDTPIKYIPVPTPNNGGGNNGGGGGNIPTPQPQPNPTPQPEPNPAPVPVTPETPEQPVAPVTPEQPAEPATPQYMDGQRELPNTGTEAHSSLAALGLLGALSGFGLIARKKRKDEE